MKKDFLVRIFFGFIYVLLIICCTTSLFTDILNVYLDWNISPYYLFYGLISLFLVLILVEAVIFMGYKHKICIIITFIIIGVFYYTFSKSYFLHTNPFKSIYQPLLVVLLFIIALIIIFKFPNELFSDTSKIIFLLAYIGIPFSLVLTFPRFDKFEISNEIFLIFLLNWISDSFAYLIGRKFGKRKLAPNISPNKTIEGAIGGFIFTIIMGITIQLFFQDSLNLHGNWIIISIIVAFISPIGDLAESKLKRVFGVKDSGKIMPGHGGMLDRLDSFITCIPFIYLYYFFLDKFIYICVLNLK